MYRCLADYREHHPRFLPPAFSDFSDFQVEQGGVGAGTAIRFRLKTGGRRRTLRQRVAERAPGRVLTESDLESSGVTTVTVLPDGDHSRVRIATTWQGADGRGGFAVEMRPVRLLHTLSVGQDGECPNPQ